LLLPNCGQSRLAALRAIERGAWPQTTGTVSAMWPLSAGWQVKVPEVLIQPSSEQEDQADEQEQTIVCGHRHIPLAILMRKSRFQAYKTASASVKNVAGQLELSPIKSRSTLPGNRYSKGWPERSGKREKWLWDSSEASR
jgi:hypothetical protein